MYSFTNIRNEMYWYQIIKRKWNWVFVLQVIYQYNSFVSILCYYQTIFLCNFFLHNTIGNYRWIQTSYPSHLSITCEFWTDKSKCLLPCYVDAINLYHSRSWVSAGNKNTSWMYSYQNWEYQGESSNLLFCKWSSIYASPETRRSCYWH